MSEPYILIIDDEQDIRFLLREILEDEGYQVAEAPHSEAAYAHIASNGMPSLVILDIWLENSDRDGIEILGDLKKRSEKLPVLMISGHGNIELAVRAIKLGAFEFIEKPFNTDKLLQLVAKALDAPLKNTAIGQGSAVSVQPVANVPEMQNVLKSAKAAAQGNARVLLMGAWGTGREYWAKYIHQQDHKTASKPFVKIACAKADKNDFAAAFASEGTVFLRDVQNLDGTMQAELLTRLKARPDVRVMASATPMLLDMRDNGAFLPDLYERLSVVQLDLPTLDARRGDLPALCSAILGDLVDGWFDGRRKAHLSDDALDVLRQITWDAGQINALKSTLSLALLRAHGANQHVIQPDCLPLGQSADGVGPAYGWLQSDLRSAREGFERWYFEQLMRRFDDNISQTASFAGIDRTSLHRKLKSLKDEAA